MVAGRISVAAPRRTAQALPALPRLGGHAPGSHVPASSKSILDQSTSLPEMRDVRAAVARPVRFTNSFAPPDEDTIALRKAKAREERRLASERAAQQVAEREARRAEQQRLKALRRHDAASAVQSAIRGRADRRVVMVSGSASV